MKRLRSLLSVLVVALCLAQPAAAVLVALLLPFMATITDAGGNPVDGPRVVTFTLYDADGASRWSETRTVNISRGRLNVQLGEQTPIPRRLFQHNVPFTVGIKVGSDPEMSPRLGVGAVPIAMSMPGIAMNDQEDIMIGYPAGVVPSGGARLNVNGRMAASGLDLSAPGGAFLWSQQAGASTYEVKRTRITDGTSNTILSLLPYIEQDNLYRMNLNGSLAPSDGIVFPDGSLQATAPKTYAAGPGLGLMEQEGIFYFSVAPSGIKTGMLDTGAVTSDKLAADPASLAKLTGGRATVSLLSLELKDVIISSVAGPNTPVAIGARYRDNGIVAWARIAPNGTIISEFGIDSVTHPADGTYVFTLNASAGTPESLAPVVTPTLAQGPPSANTMRFATVQVTSANSLTVYTTGYTFAPVDSAFTLIVTGR